MTTIEKTVFTSAKSFWALLIVFGLFFSMPSHSIAQEEAEEEKEEEEDPWADVEFAFDDETLLVFFDANQEVSALQRSTQERINETIEDHGLTRDRFDQIARAAQIGALQGGNFSNEEIEAFNQVAPHVTEIQREMQGMVQVVVEDYDINMDKYRQILNEFRQDQELQEYVSHLARERAREKILEERRREAKKELERKKAEEEEEEEGGE